jgi:two-component system, LuxR family, sensor kinase FixL
MMSMDPLRYEIENMRTRLAEALEALEAIRSGDVDAVVVYNNGNETVYTLQGAEQPYRVMVEAMNEGAATLSKDGLILWGNSCLAELLGYPLEALLGTSMLTHVAPNNRPAIEAILTTPGHEGHKIEVDLLGKSGNRVPVLLSASALEDSSLTANLCLVLTDLTEQKRTAEIAAAERMAAAIIEQVAEAIVVCDTQGRITRASKSAYELAGQNLLGQPFEAVFPLRFDEPEQDEVSTHPIVDTPENISLPTVHAENIIMGVGALLERKTAEGDLKTFSLVVSSAPLYLSDDGQTWGRIITMTDLTERKRAEEEIRKYARQLERSNKDLQDFAFIASHDLQEPLRKIRAFGEILKDKYGDRLDEEGCNYIERMQSGEERMRKMINELLAYSRVATKAQPFEPVDLDKVIHEVLSDLEIQLNQTGGGVEVDKLPVIDADPMQMRHLLQNMLSNALKFHQKENAPQITVKAARVNGSKVQISIKDNGIGFSMEHADVIFKPFQRLHGRSEYTGSGIGLAICSQIVERHNGEIIVNSAPGQGSTFTIILPVRQKTD